MQSALERQELWRSEFGPRLKAVPGDLSKPLLGLSPSAFTALAADIDIVYHCGAQVTVLAGLAALRAVNVAGTHEVLRLCGYGCAKRFHYVSSLSVMPDGEGASGAPSMEARFDLGEPLLHRSDYARSKWCAEQLVVQAAARRLAATIYRPGRITGHSETGVSNLRDTLSLMIAASLRLGVAPRWTSEIRLTPVDVVSRLIVEMSSRPGVARRAVHIVSPATVAWTDVVDVLSARGLIVDVVSPDRWRVLIDRALDSHRDLVLELARMLLARPRFSLKDRREQHGTAPPDRTTAADAPIDHVTLVNRYVAYLDAVLDRMSQSIG